jgi:sarcosine oxidase subunit gamma
MSELAVTALNGAEATGLVRVSDMGLQGMVTLKADLANGAVAKAIRDLCGAEMPSVRAITMTGQGAVAWMAPDEMLILCPYAQADDLVAGLSAALIGQHHLAVNVSDARIMIELQGDAIRDVLAKLTPADLHPDTLKPGEMRRSRLAQVPVAFWFADDTTVRLIAFRSVARYVFDALEMSARPGGAVGYHTR